MPQENIIEEFMDACGLYQKIVKLKNMMMAAIALYNQGIDVQKNAP